MTFFEELIERGVVKDVSSPELKDKLNNESITFYLGTDPTADSLHIGHYASFVTAKRLALHGHKPIILVGGATGLIGDPRPTMERAAITKEFVQKDLESKELFEVKTTPILGEKKFGIILLKDSMHSFGTNQLVKLLTGKK